MLAELADHLHRLLRGGARRAGRGRDRHPVACSTTGAFSSRFSGSASPSSSEYGRLMTSKRSSVRSHSSSLSISLAWKPALALEHRDGHLAEAFRVDLDLAPGRELQRPGRVPELVEKARRMPEERRVLLEKHADPAEEHLLAADVRLVGLGRRVDRRQHDVVAAPEQLGRERVVAQAAAAVHAAGAARERQDAHASRRRLAAWNDRRA